MVRPMCRNGTSATGSETKSRSQTYSEAQYFYLEKLGRREGADPLSAIVAELEGNAEVVTAQEADCRLQLVF
jgi:hypothetical protein